MEYLETLESAQAVDDTDRRKPRWIVFVGDILPQEFKRHFVGMHMGGENLGQDFKTLRLTKGLLRRCQLTPMTLGYDFLNADTVGDDKSKVKSRSFYDAEARRNETQYYVECLPGDEIESALSSGPADMGIREVVSLRGEEPVIDGSASLASALQRRIFPDWDAYMRGEKQMFSTVSALEQHLHSVSTPNLKSVIDVLLESADQYRRWGTSYLDRNARLVKAAPTEGGKVYGWEPLSLALFDQLELNREEFLMKKTAETKDDSEWKAQFTEMQKQFTAILPAIGVLAQQAAGKAKKEVKEDTVKIGDPVTINGKTGKVAAKRFGRIKVEFEDGTETEVPSGDLKAK